MYHLDAAEQAAVRLDRAGEQDAHIDITSAELIPTDDRAEHVGHDNVIDSSKIRNECF